MSTLERARDIAAEVADPELPMLTIADLGILRDVEIEAGRIIVSITPTYSGCPAMGAIRADITRRLADEGLTDVEVRTVLQPAWTTDWISAAGRRKLAAGGIAPPGPARNEPTRLTLVPRPPTVTCPQCGSSDTVEISHFGATACKALYRCRVCAEPFERVKEH